MAFFFLLINISYFDKFRIFLDKLTLSVFVEYKDGGFLTKKNLKLFSKDIYIIFITHATTDIDAY